MYSKQEASLIRKKFWTSFGQYMRPLTGANGDTVNWLNYKTGIKHLYFRMDADNKEASISIELRHPDSLLQQQYFDQFLQIKKMLEVAAGEEWKWQRHQRDEDGSTISCIGITMDKVNIFDQKSWPVIISFLKPRIIALDHFWNAVKDGFE